MGIIYYLVWKHISWEEIMVTSEATRVKIQDSNDNNEWDGRVWAIG